MEQYYQGLITRLLKDLRDALITAICYLMEQDKQIPSLKYGNETLVDVIPVIDDRGHVNAKKTELNFEVWDKDGLEMDMTIKLNQATTDWLMNIYEKLSGHNIK